MIKFSIVNGVLIDTIIIICYGYRINDVAIIDKQQFNATHH
jgi:hypothetical protein